MDSQPVSPADLADALCIPVGTLEFTYTSETLFDADASGTILDQIAGQSHFRIERLPNLKLSFFHTSPGVGTRVAQIDLSQVEVAGTVEIGISWEPQNIALFLRPRIDGARGVVAHGSPSEVQFLVSPDGFVIAVGGPGVEVIGARMTTGGRQVIEPTAIEAWNETLKAIEVLWNASSADGFIYESVRTNRFKAKASLPMLIRFLIPSTQLA